jgi:hypothetical protein
MLMSGSPVPVRRIDVSPQVTRWRAERARREARRSRDRRQGYAWPADRDTIVAVTAAAGCSRRDEVVV